MTTKRKSKDYIPVTVPFSAASHAGDPRRELKREISAWANRSVWTERMLDAHFTERGYRSLRTAHSGYVQSLRGNH